MQYKKMQEMIANSLTKSLGPIAFKKFIKYPGLITKVEVAKRAKQK